MDNNQKSETLISLRAKADIKMLPTVIETVRKVTHEYGMPDNFARDLELASEEACHNVIEHAYEIDEDGYYYLEIRREPGRFVVTVKDQGIPFNLKLLKEEKPHDLGIKLMRAMTDEVNSHYLGKEGKIVELVKYLPSKNVESSGSLDNLTTDETEPVEPESVSLRLMRPDETVALARCIYKVYGYSYPHEDIYYPKKFASLIDSGLVKSCVAVTDGGEVVGHLGIFLETPEDKVGESALAAVDPRYRGQGLFPRMKKLMMEEAGRHNLLGLYSRAVTAHIASQKSNVKMGSKLTGFIIAHSPPTAIFKKMETEEDSYRRSVALFYVPVAADIEKKVYIPQKHAEIMEKIYSHLELERDLSYPLSLKVPLDSQSQIYSHLIPEMGSVFLRVGQFGVNFIDELRLHIQDMLMKGVELIVLDLPLEDPATALLCPKIEELGFFFSGVMPEFLNGDAITLQYLNNVSFDPSKVAVYSDFGEEIFSYVVEQWQKTGEI
jgi:anti-sigma regulatory factor (Ser/Thr protein kinase)